MNTKLNILFIPNGDNTHINIGDNVYVQGAHSIVKEAIGEYNVFEVPRIFEKFRQHFKGEVVLEIEQLLKWKIDAIVYTGGPTVPNNFHKSNFYRTFKFLNDHFPDARKVAIGLGGDYKILHHTGWKNGNESFEKVREIFDNFNFTATRDVLTNRYLQLAGKSAANELDTSVFFPMKDYIKKLDLRLTSLQPVFVFKLIDKRSPFYLKFERQAQYIYNTYKPKTVCINKKDLEDAKRLGIECEYFCTYKQLLPIYASASFIVSGRVHQAVLGCLLGKKVYLIPHDNRYYCAAPLGVIQCYEGCPQLSEGYGLLAMQDIIDQSRERLVLGLKWALRK